MQDTLICSPERFDEIRAANPDVAMSLYAMTPGGPVTLEIITPDEQVFTFQGVTAAEALALAFPPEPLRGEAGPSIPSVFD